LGNKHLNSIICVSTIFDYLEVGEAALAGGPADAAESEGGQVQAAPRCSQSAQAVLPLLQD